MASVSLKNIYKTYKVHGNNFTAVSNLSLDIKDKEFIVLVGPSGCGKSTTLRMIAGLEDISQGELYIDDILANDLAARDRDIAMVFQDYALYPHMTVFDNMAFSLKMKKFPKQEIKTKVNEAAEILGISSLLDRKPKELSGGQRQRVALGRAIVREPKIFLLDEPLSNLDAKLRAQMRLEISKLHHRLQTTFIYVTHDQTEAMTMGDRIVVMKDGFVQQIDTPINLYDHPCNKFVAGFIGTPQINFMLVKLKAENGSVSLEHGDIRLKAPDSFIQTGLLDKYIGSEVWLGVRPEDVHMYGSAIFDDSYSFDAVIENIEVTGHETLLYTTASDVPIVANIKADPNLKLGQTVKLAINMNKIHIFDISSEETLI